MSLYAVEEGALTTPTSAGPRVGGLSFDPQAPGAWVAQSSRASLRFGVFPGDRVVRVDGHPIEDLDALEKVWATPHRWHLVTVERDERPLRTILPHAPTAD